jgi:hypothetical protein
LPEKKKDSWLINQGKQEPGKNDGKNAHYCAILRPHCFVISCFFSYKNSRYCITKGIF